MGFDTIEINLVYIGCSYNVIFILSYLKASYIFIGAVCHANENKIQCFGALSKMLTCDDYHHVGLGKSAGGVHYQHSVRWS